MSISRLMSGRTLVLAALAAGALALALAVLLAQKTAPSAAGAADHLDAPGLTPPGGDPRLDITDIYAFQSPRNKKRTVLVLNVNPLSKAGKQVTFASGIPAVAATKRAAYWLRVDNDGDGVQDVDLRVTFGNPSKAGVQSYTVARNGKTIVTGASSAFGKVAVAKGSGVKAYAGVRDDPFFFDLPGFLDILSKESGKSFLGCTSPRKDTFAGANVSSIVLELPSSMLTAKGSSKIGVWGATTRGGAQVDRMGRPAIATVFIPQNPFEANKPSQKSVYNHGQPKNDQARFRSEIVDTLTLLHSLNDAAGDDSADDPKKVDGLADVLLPDILTFDTASSDGFLNGRKLADDVIDAELNLITEGAATTDCVSKNDRAFSNALPYLAAAH